MLEPLFKALVTKYVNFRQQISIKGYVAALQKIDIENVYYFHMNLLGLTKLKNNSKYHKFVETLSKNHFHFNIVK